MVGSTTVQAFIQVAEEEEWAAAIMEDIRGAVLAITNNRCNFTEWIKWAWVAAEAAAISNTEVVAAEETWATNNTELQTIKDLHQGIFLTKPAGVSKLL